MSVPIEKIGRVTSKSVLKCTGKDWDQWVRLLDLAGAKHWSHPEIVAFLKMKHKLSLWWQQGVATGYEIFIERKVEGRNLKGEYSTAASKVFPVAQKDLWKFITSEKGLAIWLQPFSSFDFKPGNSFECPGGIYGEIRTMKAPERVRLRMHDDRYDKPTTLQITVIKREKGKSILVFQHEQLADVYLRAAMKEQWKNVLINLRKSLE